MDGFTFFGPQDQRLGKEQAAQPGFGTSQLPDTSRIHQQSSVRLTNIRGQTLTPVLSEIGPRFDKTFLQTHSTGMDDLFGQETQDVGDEQAIQLASTSAPVLGLSSTTGQPPPPQPAEIRRKVLAWFAERDKTHFYTADKDPNDDVDAQYPSLVGRAERLMRQKSLKRSRSVVDGRGSEEEENEIYQLEPWRE